MINTARELADALAGEERWTLQVRSATGRVRYVKKRHEQRVIELRARELGWENVGVGAKRTSWVVYSHVPWLGLTFQRWGAGELSYLLVPAWCAALTLDLKRKNEEGKEVSIGEVKLADLFPETRDVEAHDLDKQMVALLSACQEDLELRKLCSTIGDMGATIDNILKTARGLSPVFVQLEAEALRARPRSRFDAEQVRNEKP